jgi:FkbM family methyltransferase
MHNQPAPMQLRFFSVIFFLKWTRLTAKPFNYAGRAVSPRQHPTLLCIPKFDDFSARIGFLNPSVICLKANYVQLFAKGAEGPSGVEHELWKKVSWLCACGLRASFVFQMRHGSQSCYHFRLATGDTSHRNRRGKVVQASRRRIEELLWVFGLNKLASPIWTRLRGGRAVRQSRFMRAFYSSLLAKDALVFDIGANVGTMTTIFASLGARVVAVEPNPDCARHIELTTSRSTVQVLQAAVGERNGLAELEVSDRKDKMSSLSGEWREAVSQGNRDYAALWNRKLTVPMITLDSLVQRYELPFYIKIDVEGYEEQVLKALSKCPPLLSFEFNRMFLESALRALDNSIFDQASFNYTLVDPVKFELQDWVNRDQLRKRILESKSAAGLGDIFVRSNLH